MPRLIAAAPVADRAWALPRWFHCLARQTRRPDGVLLIHSGEIRDDTWEAAVSAACAHGFELNIQTNDLTAHARHDNERFRTLAALRNELLERVGDLGAELLLSIDTDVMLTNAHTIERLEHHIDEGADIASPATFLHPAASDPAVEGDHTFWAYNAGWWKDGGTPHDPTRDWVRHETQAIHWGSAHRIDIPMAVWLGNEKALDCRYEWHRSGEDLGFAQDLDERDLLCVWDTGLRAEHIWCPEHLRAQEAAA